MLGLYEYIAIYVDDLSISERDPKSLMDSLEKIIPILKERDQFNFIPDVIYCDRNGVLWFLQHKYIDKMVHTYMNMFGTNPKLQNSVRDTLQKGDHPDIDTSALLDNYYTQKYQSLIGYLQWDI